LALIALLALGLAAALWGWWRRQESRSRMAPSATRDGAPSWSPDGSRIAFFSERDGNSELYVMNADGTNATRLTRQPSSEGYPQFSPEGRSIAFDSDREGNFDIFVMDADGTNVRRVTRHPARDLAASWSPDGRTLVFMSDRAGSGFDIYSIQRDGTNERRLTSTSSSWFPVYSRDGSKLAFHVERDVHIMPAGGGALQRLTTDPANGMHPSWSPDGRRIAFMSWRNGRTELFLMNADGSNQQRIVSMDRGDAIDPRWSPDGSRIVFVHLPDGMQGAERTIWVVNADGSQLKRLSVTRDA
jgi:TolB protein